MKKHSERFCRASIIGIDFLYICSMKKIFLITLFIVFAISINGFTQKNGNLGNTRITVHCTSAVSSVTLTKTPLKYNKLFAFSAQLDDGGLDIYTNAYPFLNGGSVSGITYPGLQYTDGCGNEIKFRMSSSIFSFDDTETIDVHEPGTGWSFLNTWPQLIELYQQGWGISNHGLTNKVGEYEYSLERNHSYVKLKTQVATPGGVRLGIFVNPNGDTNYTKYAFQQGYHICYVQGYNFGYPSFDVTSAWNHNNIRMGRTNFYNGISIAAIAQNMALASISGAHHWGVVFSHSITNGTYGYDFETFKSQMTAIAYNYGKSGADNIWMTTEEEVLDYLLLSPYLTVNSEKSGNDVIITFAGNLPTDFRYYAVSLLLNTDASIQTVNLSGPGNLTYNGQGTKQSLININWDKATLLPDTTDPEVNDAEKWVSKTETSQSQLDANIAVDYVEMLSPGTVKDSFRRRLCNISGLIYPKYFCALGVEDHQISSDPRIFLNPATGSLVVSSTVAFSSVSLLSLQGKVLIRKEISALQVLLDVSGLSQGIYLLSITSGSRVINRKVIINKIQAH